MEAECLPDLVKKVESSVAGVRFELIIVDDNSSDGTADIAQKLNDAYGNIRVIRRPGKMGLGSAVADGLSEAGGQNVAVMDADLQHPPELLPRMLEKIQGGCDVVVASRYAKGGRDQGLSFVRRVISRGAAGLARIALPRTRNVSDRLSGYFMFRKSALENVQLNPIGYKILLEVLVKGRYEKVCEIPFVFERRLKGKSKLGNRELWNYLRHLYILQSETQEYVRFLKFCLVGLTGIGVNEITVWALTEYAHIYPLVSALVGAEVSILSNFLFNEIYTFRDLVKRSMHGSVLRRVLQFNWTRAAGIVLSLVVFIALTSLFGWNYLLANLGGILVSLVWGYSTSVTIVWEG